jgi:hypothetical protein
MKVILSIPDEGYFEHTWWRLFWAYLMKVILSVPDEGYFEHTWWRLFWAYLMKVILSVPDENYFERTWWRLFWAYLMKVILSVPDEGYFRNVKCRLSLIYVFFTTKHYTLKRMILGTWSRLILIWSIVIIPISKQECPSWSWSYGSWIYNYMCNQCLSPLML